MGRFHPDFTVVLSLEFQSYLDVLWTNCWSENVLDLRNTDDSEEWIRFSLWEHYIEPSPLTEIKHLKFLNAV